MAMIINVHQELSLMLLTIRLVQIVQIVQLVKPVLKCQQLLLKLLLTMLLQLVHSQQMLYRIEHLDIIVQLGLNSQPNSLVLLVPFIQEQMQKRLQTVHRVLQEAGEIQDLLMTQYSVQRTSTVH